MAPLTVLLLLSQALAAVERLAVCGRSITQQGYQATLLCIAMHQLWLAFDSRTACLLRVARLAPAEGVQLRQLWCARAPVHVRGK